jgi:hypothetical protein
MIRSVFLGCVIVLASVARGEDRPVMPLGAVLGMNEMRPDAGMISLSLPDGSKGAPKSKALAVLYSAVLPGMGELYGSAYETGKYFTVAEVVLWLGYAGMSMYGSAQSTDAHTFAGVHAGANTGGKDDQFFTNVANFTNTEQYNDKKVRDGNFSSVYSGSGFQWTWDTEENRVKYRSMNLSANALLDNIKYVGAAIVLNHLASAVDAVLQVNRYNHALSVSASPALDRGAFTTRVHLAISF